MAAPRRGGGMAGLFRQAAQEAKVDAVEDPQVDDYLSSMLPAHAEQPKKLKIFSVIDYIESKWGLDRKLYPVQRFIVKLYYHLPLDDKEKTIEIWDMFRENLVGRFTEVEYLRHLYNEGRCNIKEQDHERRELVLAIGRRGGKCVEGDSLVLTDRGIFRIEDLGTAPEDDHTPLDTGVVQEGGRRSRSSAFYNGGVKTTYAVRTESGYSITGTANHRIKVLSSQGRVEWRYLDEIKAGDCVALNRSSDLWASESVDLRPFHNEDGRKDVQLPVVLDEKLGNLLGYLVGDGTWGGRDGVTSVTVEHSETWTHLQKLFSELFGECRIQMDTRTENTGRIEFHSVRVRRFLHALGWEFDCARDAKHIPWSILRSPKPVVCAFLRGLFETDGCAESGGRKVTFSSASFRLAHEVQVLLLNLGVVSSVHKKWNKTTKKHYANLTLKGVRSRQLFADLIGFESDKKRGPMLAALAEAQEGKSDTESIPCQLRPVRDWLESIPTRNSRRGELGWGRSKLREALGNACKLSGEDLTYPRLRRAVGVAKEVGAGSQETAHFEELLRLDYFYDPVASVEVGEHQVYDLCVPDGESFVANGMTNHNTMLSSIFASYEVYRLLNMYNPQKYYGLPDGNTIQIVSVATDKEQASILFREVSTHMAHCEYFHPYKLSDNKTFVDLQTPFDLDTFGTYNRHADGKFVSYNGKSSIRVTFRPCVAKGLRGMGNIVIILDEMAHFIDEGGSSAEEIYKAVQPSAATFSPKGADGMVLKYPNGQEYPVESRIICISSPLNKQGQFYDLFNLAMTHGEGAENMLALQMPTWEINPSVPISYYRQRFHADPNSFMVEHGARFSDRMRGWIERPEDLLACIDPELRPRTQGIPRAPHQGGLDVAAVGDGTAFVLSHVEGDLIIIDYHEIWYAGMSWREANPHLDEYTTPYARTLQDQERLDFDEIANWMEVMCKRFYITDVIFDRWEGLSLEQNLHKRGLKQFRSERFQKMDTSQMFQATKLLMYDRKLRLYDWPAPTGVGDNLKHSPLITELMSLQATQTSKNIVEVEAPKGKHDDMSDALVRSVWLSVERLGQGRTLHGATSTPTVSRATGLGAYQMSRARMHGGFSERTIPRNLGIRFRR